MAKIKTYKVVACGGEDGVSCLYATCITNACKQFIGTFNKPATYALYSRDCATIRYEDCYGIMGDFVIQEV